GGSRTRDRADRGPDHHRGARVRPGRGGRARRGRPGARPREDRGRRAPPRDGSRRARLRLWVRPRAGCARVDGRARRPQPRRGRHGRRRHGLRRRTTGGGRRRDRRRRGAAGSGRMPAPDRGAPLRCVARGRHLPEQGVQRGGARARLVRRDAVPHPRVPRPLRDPEAEDPGPRARRRRPVRDRPAPRVKRLLTGAYVVTMDDAGTEHAEGWVLVEGDAVSAVGSEDEPEADERTDLGGALVTPGLVNTHHHLFQTLTRARAQEADLFTWLRELYPVWALLDAEAEDGAARPGLAELALSGCTTVFDHHYVFPRGRDGLIEAEVQAARELGVRLVASRGSMDLGASDGGLPPDDLVEELDVVLADTERLVDQLPQPRPGAPLPDPGAPCPPLSPTPA